MKQLRYSIEAFLSSLLYRACSRLPLDTSSALFGRLTQWVGPCMGAHKTAERNLSLCLPELSPQERKEILHQMWDNLGRVFGEYPHLAQEEIASRITVASGMEHIESARNSGKSILFISGHFGNWELAPVLAHHHGMSLHLLYRAANNPQVDDIVRRIRSGYSAGLHVKGTVGVRETLRAIEKGEHVGMLVDQKTNDGIAVPFFGRDAMTMPAVAQLALKYDIIVLPAKIVRIEGVHFAATIYPPFEPTRTGQLKADIIDTTTRMNTMIEGWIREDPSQWFWVHNRWPKTQGTQNAKPPIHQENTA